MEFLTYIDINKISILGKIPLEYADHFLSSASISEEVIDLVFVIDTSGSMADSLGTKTNFNAENKIKSKTTIVCEALHKCFDYIKILSQNKQKIRISLISFKDDSYLLFDKLEVSDSDEFNDKISKINILLQPKGSTNIYKAFKKSEEQVSDLLKINKLENINVFVMTDGYNSYENENKEMIEFFHACPYKNRYLGMGIGNVTDYDNKLLDSLFSNLKGSPSSHELSDNIIGDTFGACSKVFSNFNITFHNVEGLKYYGPLELKSNDDNTKLIFHSDSIDFSQKFIFTFESDTEIMEPILIDISYNNLITKESVNDSKIISTGIEDKVILDRINTLCKLITQYKELFTKNLSHSENMEKTKNIIQQYETWKEDERSGDICDIWTDNETMVKNHLSELSKYHDHPSYSAYTSIQQKQTLNTVSIGLSPALSRNASEGVSRNYSARQKSCPLPEVDIEQILSGLKRQTASPNLQNISSVTGVEEDQKTGYSLPDNLNIDG
jgi:hypothetical protein